VSVLPAGFEKAPNGLGANSEANVRQSLTEILDVRGPTYSRAGKFLHRLGLCPVAPGDETPD
jgi:hypothetical protein